ncbi:putative small multi-drug export protein [bacterium BMS3Abin05]|nr:putative small multi-drug export protein [bacterium BMS3Abin05]GBE28934.1 putative small multi-drug export protein [bacterium BMS3Bbin03]
MLEHFVQYFHSVPRELLTLFISMIPIFELRGAIPWALANPPIGGGLDWQTAFIFAYIGNFIPVIPLLLFLNPVTNFLRRFTIFDRFFDWLFKRTRRKGKLIEKYEIIGLILYVGIPLPGTGAWTGSLAAYLFGIKFKNSLFSISVGIVLAGIIVTLASLGVISIF